MSIVGIVAVAVVTAFLATMLRRNQPEQAMAVSLFAGVLLVVAVIGQVAPLFGNIRDMLESSGMSGAYIGVLFKALGICVITQLASDACRDAGEQGLAAKAEFAGKMTLLSLALPLFEQIGELALSLVGEI